MKIILKYIFNSVKERKLRAFVMLLSVTLSTTLLFVSLGIGASYESAQRKMAIGYAGKARLAITNTDGTSWITKSEIPKVSGIADMAGLLTVQGLYAENGYFENVDILSASMGDLNAIHAPRVKSGSLSDFTGYQIAVPDRFANQYQAQVGDWLTLKINGDYYQFKIAAICAYDTVFLRSTRGFSGLIPLETISEIVGSKGAYSEILIVPESNGNLDKIGQELSERISTDSYRISPVYNEASVLADARQKSMPFYLISFFVLTISTFIIYASYKIITWERLPVLGTFRSIGAAQHTIANILMGESLVYGISGSLLGVPAGFLTLKLLLYGMGNTASYGIEIPMVVSFPNILLACSVSIATSLLGAYIPVKGASRLPVKNIVLGTVQEKTVSHFKTMFFGLALFLISIFLPRIAAGNLLMLSGGFSLLTLIISAILIIPLLLHGASYVLEAIYGGVFGNIGRLAARNLRGNKSSNQNVTLLFISISAIIVISVVGSFVNAYIGGVFNHATLDGFSDVTADKALIEEVRNLDTVTEVLPLYVLDDTVRTNGQSLRIEATHNISLFHEMLAVTYPAGEQKAVENVFENGRHVVVSKDALKALQIQIGDRITLSNAANSFDYTVVGSFQSRADDVAVVLPSDYAVSDFGATDYGFFAYQAGDPEQVMVQIRNLLGEKQHWSRTVEEFTNDALDTVGTFLAPMNNLNYFILLLAAVGIINNLLINYIQKKRSIAMYKSVGLSNAQNIKAAILESFSVGLAGSLLAVVVSYLEIKTVFLVIGQRISMEPELQISTFLFAAFMGIVITLIGSVVPMIKSANMKLVEEIKF